MALRSRPPSEPGRSKPSTSDRQKREITADELALWRGVAKSVSARRSAHENEQKLFNSTALNGVAPSEPSEIPSKPPRPQPKPRAGATTQSPEQIQPFSTVEQLGPSTPGLDRNTSRRLKQGKLKPEARIDLHGMTVARAHDALLGFILREQAAGGRCVLVITGKGGGREERNGYDWRSNDRIGVLKSMTPQWLRAAPLGPLVVGVYPAHQRHGGEGAFYVYLRKTR